MNQDYRDLVARSRLRPIPDLRVWYPELGFGGLSAIRTNGHPILVTDPIYICDVFNQTRDPVATYIRMAAVIVTDFGGDVSTPIWWRDPFLVLPLSAHMCVPEQPPIGWVELATEVGCDSASFMFLVRSTDLPDEVLQRIEVILSARNGALLNVPSGIYKFWLEQFEGYSQANVDALYRNIVAERVNDS